MSKEHSRWTLVGGSRAEGAIVYDDGAKIQIHHDSAISRGQHNSWDLVRLHKFGALDKGVPVDTPIAERPSTKAMYEFARSQPEIQQALAASEFEDLGPLPAESAASKFKIYDAVDFSSGPPMQWIVRDILPRAELAVVYGESGSGKSFWILDVCAAVTRGVDWRTKRVKPGKVVYVCAEGAGGFKARIKAYRRQNDNVTQLPAVIPTAPNLLEAKDPALLIKEINAWGVVDVVVIDTLSASTPGGNENAGEDMGRAIAHCKAIHAATGALVVLIHHSGKDAAKGARGWSGLKAATDAEIEITRSGHLRCATISKMKDGEDGPRMPFRLNRVLIGLDEDGEELSSCVVEHTDDAPPRTVKKLNARQQCVLDTLRAMAPDGGDVDKTDLVEGALSRDPDPGRRRDYPRAIEALCDYGYAEERNGRVKLLGAIEQPEQDWLA